MHLDSKNMRNGCKYKQLLRIKLKELKIILTNNIYLKVMK